MAINPKSATTLAWASAMASILGMLILSPAAGFVLYLLAVILSLIPIISGPKVARITATVVFLISLALAYHGYPAFDKERHAYRKHVEVRSVKIPAPATVQQQEKK